jgi:sporulation protein YlmC with PRC-barrel domain
VKALVRGSDMVGVPIVTVAGDDIAEVRDVVFDGAAGRVLGFTLNRRGRLARRMKETLARANVSAVGPHAVIVADEQAVGAEIVSTRGETPGGNVLGNRVMTDTGVNVGTVTDVVIDTAVGSVVGYEIEPADEATGRHGRRSYIPLPDAGAVSGEALMVPIAAVDYITTDFAGFAEAVDRFRASMRRGPP